YTSSSSSSSSNSDIEVSTCSKSCLKSYKTLKEYYDNIKKDFNKSQLNVEAYKADLEFVKARLDVYKKNEAIFEEDIKILKLDIMFRDNALTELRKKFEKAEKERDDLKLTLEKFENSSKNLSKLLDSQEVKVEKVVSTAEVTTTSVTTTTVDELTLAQTLIEINAAKPKAVITAATTTDVTRPKTGVRFDSQVNDKYQTGKGYHAVPPSYTGNFLPPKPDLILANVDEYVREKILGFRSKYMLVYDGRTTMRM
nr:hypothetical protein [Tanacetum cinerariifolium]